MASSATRRCSVHFGDVGDEKAESSDAHNNDIVIQRFNDEERTLDLHLGFLQIYHRYVITCQLKSTDLPQATSVVQRIPEPPNHNCRLLKIESKPSKDESPGDSENIEASFEFLAHKDKIVRETIFLQDESNPESCTKVILEARVLGKGKGTPLLKNGIHCTGKFADPDESDVNSDWQGFK